MSIGSQMDLSVVPSPVTVPIECTHHSSGQIDGLWSNHCLQIDPDSDGSVVAHTAHFFAQLFKVKNDVFLEGSM